MFWTGVKNQACRSTTTGEAVTSHGTMRNKKREAEELKKYKALEDLKNENVKLKVDKEELLLEILQMEERRNSCRN